MKSLRQSVLFFSFILVFCMICNGQEKKTDSLKLRPLKSLVINPDSTWKQIVELSKKATNRIEILQVKSKNVSDSALYFTQVTTKSYLGAVIYKSGGILVNGGWIRVLGGGSNELNRNLAEWNDGKSYSKNKSAPTFFLIADDAAGGFFALNGGGISSENYGKVFYLGQDNPRWDCTGMSYSEFINFCFFGDIKKFYGSLQWKDWETSVKEITTNDVYYFFPIITSSTDIEKCSRSKIPVEEMWKNYFVSSANKK